MPSPREAFVPFTRAKASFLSCFWHKVLYDIGIVSTKEPFRKLFNQGMILAFSYRDAAGKYYGPEKVTERGGRHFAGDMPVAQKIEKMSKSRFNVVNPTTSWRHMAPTRCASMKCSWRHSR